MRRRERRSPRRSGRSRGGEFGGETYLAEQRVRLLFDVQVAEVQGRESLRDASVVARGKTKSRGQVLVAGEGPACGRVPEETAYRGRAARVGRSKKTQTHLRDVVRGRYVLRRARSPARGERIHAQLLFLPGAVAARGVALARDERLGRRRLRELPGRIRERYARAHGLEVEVLRYRAHSRDAARRVRGPREER